MSELIKLQQAMTFNQKINQLIGQQLSMFNRSYCNVNRTKILVSLQKVHALIIKNYVVLLLLNL